jgi:amino acid transporter
MSSGAGVRGTEALAGPRALRGGSLSFIETIGQSIANIGPTLTPAINIAVVAGLAGIGSWLAFVIATVGLLFVAASIGTLARRHPLAGSYFVYIGRSLGPGAGMIAGWSMVAAYLCTAVATILSGDIFLTNMLTVLGLKAFVPPGMVVIGAIGALTLFCAWHDIRISSRVGLVLEGLSIAIIVLITALVVVRHGTVVDPKQLDVTHLPLAGVMSALTFAVFCFVGFESAATLAREARDPARAIPLSITVSAAAAGVFFTVICYFMVLAVGDQTKVIGDSSSPFAEITSRAGFTWAASVVYFSALISSFACTLASVNAGARMIFSMGRYEYLPRSLGRVHDRHRTPHVAATASVLFATVVAFMLLQILAPIDAFGDAGTVATFGFLVVYLLLCIVAPMDLRRAGQMRISHAVIGGIGAALMAFVIFGSLYPMPAWPANLLPYIFGAYLLLGFVWYSILSRRSPGSLERILGDMEG